MNQKLRRGATRSFGTRAGRPGRAVPLEKMVGPQGFEP